MPIPNKTRVSINSLLKFIFIDHVVFIERHFHDPLNVGCIPYILTGYYGLSAQSLRT